MFAPGGVPSALIRGSDVIAQVVFTPLLAAWSIWLGLMISTRVSDTRVAQQLGMLASLPTIALTTLIAFNVIHASLQLALGLGVVLMVANRVGWRVVSVLFDRERLIASLR
jgi:ABC-2 type transport system permease protein